MRLWLASRTYTRLGTARPRIHLATPALMPRRRRALARPSLTSLPSPTRLPLMRLPPPRAPQAQSSGKRRRSPGTAIAGWRYGAGKHHAAMLTASLHISRPPGLHVATPAASLQISEPPYRHAYCYLLGLQTSVPSCRYACSGSHIAHTLQHLRQTDRTDPPRPPAHRAAHNTMRWGDGGQEVYAGRELDAAQELDAG
jgi:hypothetical protein